MVKWKQVFKDTVITGAVVGTTYGVTNWLSNRGNKNKKSNKDNKSTPQQNTGTGEEDTGTGTGTGSSDTGTTKTKVIEVPITNYEEALNFANREWNKIKRNNGRVLECQVQGSSNWRTGEWCKVYLPSFDIDGYMYIIRVSQSSEGGDWNTNLSLVDYPPGWGKEDLTEDNNNEDDSNSEENSDEESSDSNSEENNANGENNTNNNTNNSNSNS